MLVVLPLPRSWLRGRQGWDIPGHSGTFQDIPSAAVGAQPCPRFSRSVWNFVGGNVAGEISTCHEQIRFVREQALAFFALVGGWTVVFVCSGWRREGSVPCV